MNTIDAVVVAVLEGPWREYGVWWLKVKAESWGRESESKLMFDTEAEARAVRPGYAFAF